jgi:hypothetical protein
MNNPVLLLEETPIGKHIANISVQNLTFTRKGIDCVG